MTASAAMQCATRCLLPSILFLLQGTDSPASPPGEILLQQHRPLLVRWGEVEVTETTRVRVKSHGEEQEYPNAISIAFKGREREEDLGALLAGKPQVQSRVSPAGTVLLAGDMGEGRRAWGSLVKKLRDAASQLSPAGYDGFLEGFATNLPSERLLESGGYSLVFCISRPGLDDHAGDFKVSARRSPEESESAGFNVYPHGEPYCLALHEAFQNLTPSEVVTTGFTVDENLEEVLELRVEDRMQRPPLSWPEGASLTRTEAPEGARDYSSSKVREGVAHSEHLQMGGPKDAEGKAKSYIVMADVRPANLPKDLTKGRSILLRWEARIRATRLGAAPRMLSEENRSLVMGVFCTTGDSAAALDEMKSVTARDLASNDSLLSAAVIRSAVHLRSLGLDNFFTVYCLPGSEQEVKAEYCVSEACAEVRNPGEVCDEIAKAMRD